MGPLLTHWQLAQAKVLTMVPGFLCISSSLYCTFSNEWVVGWNENTKIPETCKNMIQSRVGMAGERKEEKRARYERARKKLSKNWNSQSIPLLCCLNLRKHCQETERCPFLKNELPSSHMQRCQRDMNSQKVEQEEKDILHVLFKSASTLRKENLSVAVQT